MTNNTDLCCPDRWLEADDHILNHCPAATGEVPTVAEMWVIGRRACDMIEAAVNGDNQTIIDLTPECPFENDLLTGRLVQLAALAIAHMDTAPDEVMAHLRGHTDRLGQHQIAEGHE